MFWPTSRWPGRTISPSSSTKQTPTPTAPWGLQCLLFVPVGSRLLDVCHGGKRGQSRFSWSGRLSAWQCRRKARVLLAHRDTGTPTPEYYRLLLYREITRAGGVVTKVTTSGARDLDANDDLDITSTEQLDKLVDSLGAQQARWPSRTSTNPPNKWPAPPDCWPRSAAITSFPLWQMRSPGPAGQGPTPPAPAL